MDHYQVSGCRLYGYYLLEDKRRIGEPYSDYGEAAEACELRNRLAQRLDRRYERRYNCVHEHPDP